MSNLKRFLALTLAMLMVVGAMAVSAKSFTDVATAAPYAEAVDVLSELGVIAGTSADEFSPDALVERQQMAMFIARLATAKPAWFAVEAAAVFKDQKDPGYNAAIAYAVTNGIILGRSSTEFDGAATVTLQEAATMLCRALGYYTNAMNAAYPMSYLMMADEIGLLKKLENVAPTDALTRGEVAIMLYNAFYAKIASVDMVYGPNGMDRIVEVPSDANAKYLSTSKWDCKEFKGAGVVATVDFTLKSNSPVATSKSIADPVRIVANGYNKVVSFASISKFFTEGATPADMLGVELKVLVKNDKIIKIDVVGSKFTTKVASYNDADSKKIVTVNGVAYNLTSGLDLTYPADGDNCFYMYVGSDIQKIAAVPASISQIKSGFFMMDVINEGRDSQMIVYKPLTFGKVTLDTTNNKLQLGGKNITKNTVGAVKDSYVTYFTNGNNLVEVVALATKSENNKVVKIAGTTVTFENGTTAPAVAPDTLPIASAELITLNLGSSYNVYSIDGKVVKTETFAASAAYTSKPYYYVSGITATADEFTGALTYKVRVVDQAGVETVKVITKINDVVIKDISSTIRVSIAGSDRIDWAGVSTNLLNEVVTLDGDKLYTYDMGASSDKYHGVVLSNGAIAQYDTAVNAVAVVKTFKKHTSIAGLYSITNGIDSVRNVILTDNTKVLVKASDGYAVFTGKDIPSLAVSFTGKSAYIYRENSAGINELTYLFASTESKISELKGVTSTTDNLYIFINVAAYTEKTKTYNVINITTGAADQLTFTNDNGYASINYAYGVNSHIYKITTAGAADEQSTVKTIRLSGGYLNDNGTIYTTTGTKYYQWNSAADKLTYETKSASDFDATKKYDALYVVINNNVAYVIVRGEHVTVS